MTVISNCQLCVDIVPLSVYQSRVYTLVLSRLVYGNATLAGLLPSLLNHLQSVLNAAAR